MEGHTRCGKQNILLAAPSETAGSNRDMGKQIDAIAFQKSREKTTSFSPYSIYHRAERKIHHEISFRRLIISSQDLNTFLSIKYWTQTPARTATPIKAIAATPNSGIRYVL